MKRNVSRNEIKTEERCWGGGGGGVGGGGGDLSPKWHHHVDRASLIIHPHRLIELQELLSPHLRPNFPKSNSAHKMPTTGRHIKILESARVKSPPLFEFVVVKLWLTVGSGPSVGWLVG